MTRLPLTTTLVLLVVGLVPAGPALGQRIGPYAEPMDFLYKNFLGCAFEPAVYVVEKETPTLDGRIFGRVVEVLKGPARERVELDAQTQALSATRVVVYVDEEGRLVQERHGVTVAHGPCVSHPEVHPITRGVRAVLRYCREGSCWGSPETVIGLLRDEDPFVHELAFAMAAAWHNGSPNWEVYGAFLASALAPGGLLRRRLDVPAPAADTSDAGSRLASYKLRWLLRSYEDLGRALQSSLYVERRSDVEDAWVQVALRVLLEAAEDPRGPVRHRARASLPGYGRSKTVSAWRARLGLSPTVPAQESRPTEAGRE